MYPRNLCSPRPGGRRTVRGASRVWPKHWPRRWSRDDHCSGWAPCKQACILYSMSRLLLKTHLQCPKPCENYTRHITTTAQGKYSGAKASCISCPSKQESSGEGIPFPIALLRRFNCFHHGRCEWQIYETMGDVFAKVLRRHNVCGELQEFYKAHQ